MTTWIISWGDSRSVAHSRVPGGASGSSSRKCVRPPSDGEYLEVWFGIDVGAGAIEDIGRGEVDHEEAAISVHDDMALAADDFLAVVVDFRPRVAGVRPPSSNHIPPGRSKYNQTAS